MEHEHGLTLFVVFLFAIQLSEITIPHFVAAMIFSAQNGLTADFYANAKLLAIMSCTYGLFRYVNSHDSGFLIHVF